jgi:hypothetical protein
MFEPGTSWVKQTAVPLRKQQGGPITVQRRKDFSSQGRQLHVTLRHMRCRLRIAITSALSLMLQYSEGRDTNIVGEFDLSFMFLNVCTDPVRIKITFDM